MKVVDEALVFSVVVPTHFRSEKLLSALKSLDHQTFAKEKFEVIVVPSPHDPGAEAARKFSCRERINVRVVEIENDVFAGKNVSAKRNHGARLATGEWIAFLDDDCVADSEWLSSVFRLLNGDHEGKENFSDSVGGVEGLTLTPENSEKTLTWKGMQRLGQFGGYQTCNIFYRKRCFEAVGGFDEVSFPWFLEDTDLAWSILGSGHSIESCSASVVFHPVGEPAPWRLIHEARGAGLKVKLYKKHPELYRQRQMRALRVYHYVYLFCWLALLLSLISLNLKFVLLSMLLFGSMISLHLLKQFKGLKTSFSEVFGVAWRTTVAPLVAFASIVRALIRHRCSFKEWCLLLSPSGIE